MLSSLVHFRRVISAECTPYYIYTRAYKSATPPHYYDGVAHCFARGGTLFRKYAFVISSIALVVGVTLLVWLSKNHEIRLFVTNYENGVIVKEQIGTVTYILTAFFAVFSIVNYWLSFHIFKGFELITNKWMNYDFYK